MCHLEGCHQRCTANINSTSDTSHHHSQKYEDRIPVICEKYERSDIATIDKKKYLVPADLTVGQFVYVIRKRIKLEPEKAIFIFVEETLPPTAMLMADLYKQYQDEDGFLYITYSGENVCMSCATLARLTRRVPDFRQCAISPQWLTEGRSRTGCTVSLP